MKTLSSSTVAALAACLPSLASAHYFFPHLVFPGHETSNTEFEYVRRSTQGFQPHFGFDILSSNDMRCNTGSANSGPSTKVASINAGDTIGFGTNLAGKIEHPGPVQAYMSKAPNGDVTTYDGSQGWFKIFELGANFPMDASGKNWLIWDKNQIDVKIPSNVPAGQYLVRLEHIALHRPSGTEFYFNCAQVEVNNTGASTEPTDLVKIPGVYNSSDPGLSPNYSIYSGATSYPFPGPSVFGASSSSPASSTAQSSGSSTSKTSGSSSAAAAPAAAKGSTTNNSGSSSAAAAPNSSKGTTSSNAGASSAAPATNPATGSSTGCTGSKIKRSRIARGM